MRVNREELLRVLESVSPGLAAREILEQSSCLAFDKGRVFTFNDEVACSRKSPVKLSGAVKAKPLLDLLSKLAEDTLDIEQKDGELLVKGKGRRSGIRMEADVLLPVDSIEAPEEWVELLPDFNEAVSVVYSCASADDSQFTLTCVHIHPDYLEACDRFQIARYPIKTGVSESTLVKADTLRRVLGFDMTEMSVTDSWLHFRNPAGLVLSCRRYIEDYKSLDKFITDEGTTPMVLPGSLEEIVSKAEIFSGESVVGNHVTVELRSDRISIKGDGVDGWYKEMKKTKFDGEPIEFLIAPKMLLEVSKKSNECGVAPGRLFIDGGKFKYVTSTQSPTDVKEKAKKEKKEKEKATAK